MKNRPRGSTLADLSHLPGVGTYEWHVAEDRLVWSPELVDLYGVGDVPAEEREFTERVHPEDRTRIEAETSSFMEAGTTYEHEFRILRPDGTVRHIHDRGVIERDPDGTPRLLRGINFDVTCQRKAIGGLHANEQRLQLACDVADIAAWDADLPSGSSVWTESLYDLLGLGHDLPASPELFFRFVHKDDLARVRGRFLAAIEARETFREDFRVVRPDGTVRQVAGIGRVVEETDGAPARMIGVNYDITDRKDDEERIRLLVGEVSHRSRNLMALVQAIARQTRRAADNNSFERFEQRLQALSASHDLLVQGAWKGIGLRDLVHSQLTHIEADLGERIEVDGPNAVIVPAAAQPLGMTLFELATNACKYGALSNSTGVVRIGWTLRGETPDERRLSIEWAERGGPVVKPPERQGFGSSVLNHVAKSALGASVETDYAPEGLTWRLESGPGIVL